MGAKPGRNDPCPCGSGKKFKKCCGHDAHPESSILPADQLTGTPLDEYHALLPFLALHEQKIIQFEPDGAELKKARSAHEKRFRPGDENGILDSHYLSWHYFDLRFGPSRKTIVERVLQDPMTARLVEPGPTCLRHMAASYPTFFQVLDSGPDVVLLDELGTGRCWRLSFFRELFGTAPAPGEIWYTRLLGPPDGAITYTTPYVYDPGSRDQFKRGVSGLYKDFIKDPLSIGVPADFLFAESQKQSAFFWMDYILACNAGPRDMLSSVPGQWTKPPGPCLVNTDKDEIVFVEMHFRVKDEQTVRRRLAKLKSFQYDEKDDSWAWLKPPSRRFPDEPRTVLGHFQFKDSRLVVETNSRERAVRLEWKLSGHLRGSIKLEKTLYKDLDDLPPETPEERERYRRETAELNARPEVQEALRQEKERHYFGKWLRMKVPAIGNVTPLQAAKTEEGRRKLTDLLDFYDRRQDAEPDQPRIDFGKLRHMLGLPAKSH